jgi:hypothetical protein
MINKQKTVLLFVFNWNIMVIWNNLFHLVKFLWCKFFKNITEQKLFKDYYLFEN